MDPVILARHAMATRFELVLHGANEAALRAAGEEALNEVDRLENQLSLYRPGSEIAQVNARAAHEPVQVSPEVFALLQHARQLHAETEGAFDITVGPLVRCWGFMHNAGRLPSPEEAAAARAQVGMNLVHLDEARRTVRFARPGVMLDLGAIGKGYAVERGTELLREAGVTSALFHGGTSTVSAIGHPPDAEAWAVAIEPPPGGARLLTSRRWGEATDEPAREDARPTNAPAREDARPTNTSRLAGTLAPPQQAVGPIPFPELAPVRLQDQSLSVSAVWGRGFQADGKHFGHVLDPRTGQPVDGAWLAAVILPSATDTDALSTALLTLGATGLDALSRVRPNLRAFLVTRSGSLVTSPSVGQGY